MEFSKLLLLVFIGGLLNSKSSHALTQEQADLIDSVIEQFQTENSVPGFSLSVVQDGEIIITKGYGKRNIEDDLSVDTDTLFAIGSISKSITSLLIVKILSEKFPELGEAVLEVPINQLDANLNFTLSDRFRSESASFRDLLSHRTCIRNEGTIYLFDASSADELVYRTRYDTEVCSHRAGFDYNNAIYAVAGNLIGKIAGISYPELINELFEQLGMTSSRLIDAEGSHEDLPNMSHAYTRIGGEVVEFERSHLRRLHLVSAAGGVLSTASDMAKYVQFHMSGGQVAGVQVIPEDVLNWMYKVAIPVEGFDYSSVTGSYGYALGLGAAFYNGQPWTTHSGYWPPYESMFSLFPQYKNTSIGLFSSINGPGTTGLTPLGFSQQLVHILIMQILNGDTATTKYVNQALSDSDVNSKILPQSFENLPLNAKLMRKNGLSQQHREHRRETPGRTRNQAEFIGLYGSAQFGDINITLHQDDNFTLEINYGKWGIGFLIPQPPVLNLFLVEWTTTLNYDFYSYGPMAPIPVFHVLFETEDQLNLLVDGVPFSYYRDATLDTFPDIPWSPDSCSP